MVFLGLRFFFLQIKKAHQLTLSPLVIFQILQCIDAFGFCIWLLHLVKFFSFFKICASFFCFQISFLPSYIFFLCLPFSSFPPFLSLFLSFLCSSFVFSLSHTFLHVASLYHSKKKKKKKNLMFPKLVSCHLHCLSLPCTLPSITHH